MLFFTSERDHARCVWARRLDPATKRPVGGSFAVYHAHDTRLSLKNTPLSELEMAVARDTIIFNPGELTSDIWMLRLDDARELSANLPGTGPK